VRFFITSDVVISQGLGLFVAERAATFLKYALVYCGDVFARCFLHASGVVGWAWVMPTKMRCADGMRALSATTKPFRRF
jgi:hypothetical protein